MPLFRSTSIGMCLLALRWGTVPGAPLVLAANRDESLDRPFDPPRLHPGPVPFVAPVDRTAGGTWIGVNAAGLVVAVSPEDFAREGFEGPLAGLLWKRRWERAAFELGGGG